MPWRLKDFIRCTDSMWRCCRHDHLDFVNQLLRTVNTIPSALLRELARLAITDEAAVVREAIVDLFAEAANCMCPREQFETAALFFVMDVRERRGPVRTVVREGRSCEAPPYPDQSRNPKLQASAASNRRSWQKRRADRAGAT
jgi:hypothetical protein